MKEVTCPARSALYPLPPIGVGTASVESLVSFFCRLAAAHCVSTTDLLGRISNTCGWEVPAKNFWKNVNLIGMGEVAHRYASALSMMTSVERLDLLTLRPWRNVIAQASHAPAKARWCGACFAHDLARGESPYFRLAWDVGDVDVCPTDGIRLLDTCHDCGNTGARNNATCVVPGWCCFCGASLASVGVAPLPATPAETWKAAQIGRLLAAQASLISAPVRRTMTEVILKLIGQLDDGQSARFARRIGLNRSTVHYWLNQGGVPTLAAHLRIASQTGVSLEALLTGYDGGEASRLYESPSLAELFPDYRKRASPRQLDLGRIKAQMDDLSRPDVTVSVMEAARRLNMHPRELYRVENEKARTIGAKWRKDQRDRSEQHRLEAVRAIEAAVKDILSRGRAANLREVQQLVPREVLGSVRGVVAMIQEAARKIEGSKDETCL
ncbi:TniQ protein [Paraburkholderia sp. BL6669N2]|uniref:TniQ family protein n=1 Tax=Paraburkholderia sp. BL6669N2 TaxID=1938807 RepID=UPI000E26AD9B|nr:TniQ family protein [Paraburkholderia sp. BL6669N2]REG51060.1 TniQ protein [Paraburkholderia sp. BL6669N2]